MVLCGFRKIDKHCDKVCENSRNMVQNQNKRLLHQNRQCRRMKI